MHQLATGSSGPVGLAGPLPSAEPPLSTETIGRAPSFLELPVPLQVAQAPQAEPIDEALAGPVESPVPIAELLPVRAPAPAERRRVVVRFLGDEELELGVFDERDAAVECARETVTAFKNAESAGDWPEVEGRHLRPASILSVDILVAG